MGEIAGSDVIRQFYFRILFFIIPLSFLQLSCSKPFGAKYKQVSPARSGIDFTNQLVENDTLNYTIFPYMYMGGGVSVGDINNDGLDDIFLSGNLVPNKLYLNRGDFRFEDISASAGIEGNKQWFAGSTMADVNDDGWLDIYVCVSAKYPPGGNVLFINNGDNTFTEQAEEYGIDDQSSSVQATFFDYNNDGLLDLYVANYPIVKVSMGPNYYYDRMQENPYAESGHLYENKGDGSFFCVTEKAGVQNFGMSIGVVAMDFNRDGWKDLYISNDFNVPDYFYFNNGDGSFTERSRDVTFQTSIFGMGFDAADMNNDGLIDLFQIDMTPEDHVRAMVNVAPMSQKTFDLSLGLGFHYQYMHNALQLNNGIFDGLPVYSNISLYAGVAYTDWSWGGLFLDMDHDANKDLFITNGVLKDINNRDILEVPENRIYFHEKQAYSPDSFPSTPLKNYAYRNNGDLTFTYYSREWGFEEENLSNGMAYGDFDNDGDLDIVISNINSPSVIYENRAVKKNHHYIKLRLRGPAGNTFGLGSVVSIKTGETEQMQELTLSRGYQSSVPPYLHFGTGEYETIDEVLISWPDGKQAFLQNIPVDQTLELNYADASGSLKEDQATHPAFKDISATSGLHFRHHEDNYQDYEYEALLPHKNSRVGPGLSVGDVNNDGRDDLYIGNAAGSSGRLFTQTSGGVFIEESGPWVADSLFEDTGALLFDADGDSRTDLYIVSGGNDPKKGYDLYQDRLYLNTDSGFIAAAKCLPGDLGQSGKCVEAADFDKDGDLDLFIGGRIVPGQYPLPANSYILQNNGRAGRELRFENVTEELAPELLELGLVTDACWVDFDQDKDLDLIILGEWMNICFFENTENGFRDVTLEKGFGETRGWWHSISPLDMDGDGDLDFVAGNQGRNYRFRASEEEAFDIYLNDFNVDGKQDIVLAYQKDGRHLPIKDLNAASRQIPVLKMRYESHEQYASSTLEEIYGAYPLQEALHYRVNTFASCWIENNGTGGFQMHELPGRAQLTSINDVLSVAGKPDAQAFIVAGNMYHTESETPRNDAGVGLLIQREKSGELICIPPSESRLMVRGEVKNMREIRLDQDRDAILFAINGDSLRLVEINMN